MQGKIVELQGMTDPTGRRAAREAKLRFYRTQWLEGNGAGRIGAGPRIGIHDRVNLTTIKRQIEGAVP